MAGEAKIVITWTPPYAVRADFPENPILCAFMMQQAQKVLAQHFDKPAGLIETASTIPPLSGKAD